MATQSHIYPDAGTFSVKQTVTNQTGSVTSDPQTVIVTAPTASTPVIRSKSQATNAAAGDTSISIPLPTGIVSGDLLIMIISQRSSSSTLTAPVAWTLRARLFSATEFQTHHVFTRVVPLGTAPTVTSNSNAAMIGTIFAIQTGTYNSNNPFMSASTAWWDAASGPSTTIPSLVAASTNGLQISQATRFTNDVVPTISATSGWIVDSRFDGSTAPAYGSPINSNYIGISQHRSLTAAGATSTGVVSTTSTQNKWSGVQFIINSPSSGDQVSSNLPGDPGSGKILISHNSFKEPYADWLSEQTRLRAISYVKAGVTKAASNARSSSMFFAYRPDDGGLATSPIGGTGSQSLEVVASGRNYFKTWAWSPAEALLYINNDPTYVAWQNQLISNFNAARTAGHTGTFWINVLSEPSGDPDYTAATAQQRANLRAAHRKLYTALKITGGCTNVAMVSPTLNSACYQDAAANWNGGSPTGVGVYNNWWEWHPDWKGTFTGWSSGVGPNPADFYTSYTSSGTSTRTVDVFACNLIDNHVVVSSATKDPASAIWTWDTNPAATTWTPTTYEQHAPFNTARNSGQVESNRHLYDMRVVLNALYGTGTAPIVIPELALATFERSSTDPLLPESLAFYDFVIQDLLNANVKAVGFWRQGTSPTGASGNIWSLGGKFTVGGITTDVSDTRRKALANWMDNPIAKSGLT